MNKNLICFENGEIILNVNSIAMIFPHDTNPEKTCVNCIGIPKTIYIKEKYEDVKKKLDNWMG